MTTKEKIRKLVIDIPVLSNSKNSPRLSERNELVFDREALNPNSSFAAQPGESRHERLDLIFDCRFYSPGNKQGIIAYAWDLLVLSGWTIEINRGEVDATQDYRDLKIQCEEHEVFYPTVSDILTVSEATASNLFGWAPL